MAKFLIHIHSGPELKNKATLGMLVAITAFKKGVDDSKKGLEEETSETAKDITPETEKDKV